LRDAFLKVIIYWLYSHTHTLKAFDKFTREKHKDTPGRYKLEVGEYLLQQMDSKEYIPYYVDFNEEFKPGAHIQMSVIFKYSSKYKNCPKCSAKMNLEEKSDWVWFVSHFFSIWFMH
jgi:hypothetical protein